MGPQNNRRLINVGNIQIDEKDLKKKMHKNMLNQLKSNQNMSWSRRYQPVSSSKNFNQSGIQ